MSLSILPDASEIGYPMNVRGIVVAGGSGTRFGGPKHSLALGGVEFWERGVTALNSAGVSDVVVVGDVPGGLPGGERRRDSVQTGLAALPDDTDWVLIHDAARPLASRSLVERVLDRALLGDVDGVVPAIPLADTIKKIDGELVVSTVERLGLVAVQTPQAFRFGVLKAAHAREDDDATDDAALVERAGGRVVHVMGDPINIKITYPDDLAIARAHMESDPGDD